MRKGGWEILSKVEITESQVAWAEGLNFIYGGFLERTGYTLEEITGIGPADAEVNYSSYAMLPGGIHHSSRQVARNIVMRVGFDPDHSVGETILDLRRAIYERFVPGEWLRVRLYTEGDGRDSYDMFAIGYLESIEPTMFSKNPELQISIICPDPYMRRPFVDSGETFTDLTSGSLEFFNRGGVSVGFEINIYPTATTTSITIENESDPESRRMVVPYTLESGGRLRIVTVPGEKRVSYYNRLGSLDNRVLGHMELYYDWPRAVPGKNVLKVSGGSFTWDMNYRAMFTGY